MPAAAEHALAPTGTPMTAEINEPRKLGLRMTADDEMPGEPRRVQPSRARKTDD